MRLCLSCRFVSPAGAPRCGRCGRSFGGRLCPRHHLSPAGSRFCVQCGRQELTDATVGLPLGCVSRLLAWGLALLAVSLFAHHAGTVAGGIWLLASWTLTHVLNVCPCRLVRAVVGLGTWWLTLLLLSWCLPESAGKPLRSLLLRLVNGGGRASLRAVAVLFAWLCRWVEGGGGSDKKSDGKRKGH